MTVSVKYTNGYKTQMKVELARLLESKGELIIVPDRPPDPPRTAKKSQEAAR